MRFLECLMAVTAIWRLSGALDLRCSTQYVANWSIGKLFTCEFAYMQITKRCEMISSARTVANYNQVKGINIQNQIVHYFPTFTDELGRRIEGIVVQVCRLKSIERDNLRPFPSLRVLNLDDNDLTSLPGDLLLSTPKIEYLSLNSNHLQFVGADILKPLTSLKQAFYINAGCIDNNAENPAEIESLKSELQMKCKPEEAALVLQQEKLKLVIEVAQLKQKIAEMELKALEDQQKLDEVEKRFLEEKTRNSQLSQQISNLEVNIKGEQKITAEMKQNPQQLGSCDRNLNSATEMLSLLLSQVALNLNHQSNVELICSRYSTETKPCNVIDFRIKNSATKVVSVKDEFGSEVRPTSLIVRHQAALFLPINLHEAFLDLEHLEVSSSGLFHVNSKTFSKLDKLVGLILTSNKISSIESGSFTDLKLLKLLDLSSNRLGTIEAGGFKGLQSIKVLNLKDNHLKQIAASFMSSMTSLNSVDLRDNFCINLVHPGTLLKDIEATIVENCVVPLKLNCIASNDHHVCDAENLQVEHAKAKILTVNGKTPENVKYLFAEDQLVKFLPDQLSRNFPKLQKLVVARSQLTVLFKNDFVGLTDLRWIQTCDNQISSIESGTFDLVAQLMHLDLSSNNNQLHTIFKRLLSNHIRSLPPKIFERLTQLVELRLSFNEINVLNSDIFPMPNAIKVFRMDNNKLEKIDTKVFALLRNANEIDLESNTCISKTFRKTEKTSSIALADLSRPIIMTCSVI